MELQIRKRSWLVDADIMHTDGTLTARLEEAPLPDIFQRSDWALGAEAAVKEMGMLRLPLQPA